MEGCKIRKAVTRMWAMIIATVVIIAAIVGGAAYYFLMLKAPEGEILIGFASGFTGKYAINSLYIRQAIEMWVEDVNARGGILRRPVKVIYYDDTSEPTVSVSLVERVITVDKVCAVFAPYGSATTFPTSTVTEKYNVPMIVTSAGSDEIYTRGFKYLFYGAPLIVTTAYGLLDLMNYINANYPPELHVKKVAIFSEDSTANVRTRDAFVEKIAAEKQKYGYVEIVFDEKYKGGTKDFTPALMKVKAAKPDVFMTNCYAADSITLTRQLKELDVNCKLYFYSTGPNTPEYIETLGKDADYSVVGSVWDPSFPESDCPGTTWLAETYRKKFGREASTYVGFGYGAAQILEAGIRAAGSTDPEKIREALAKLDMKCCLGPVKFDERGTTAPVKWFYPLSQVQKGKLVNVYSPAAVVRNLLYPAPTWAARG